jgi:YggT family protein
MMSVVSKVPESRQTVQTGLHGERIEQPPALREDLTGPTPEELEIRRRRRLAKWGQIITLIFVVLELAILFRVGLKLIAANPANPFAQFMYQMTGPFLAPFAGLTVTPTVDGSILEIPALVAMAAYSVLYVLIIRIMWVIFYPAKARDAAKYEPDL